MRKGYPMLNSLFGNIIGRIPSSLSHDAEEARKKCLVLAFISLSFPVLLAFTIHDAIASMYFDAALDLIFLSFISVVLAVLYKAKNATVIYRISVAALSTYLCFILANTVDTGSEIYWFFLVPLVSFYILGKREGGVWAFGVGVVVLFLLIARPLGGYSYSGDSIIRFAIAYLLVSFLSFAYESVRVRIYASMVHERDMLKRTNAKVKEMSVRDHLTKVYNRAYMTEHLHREMIRAGRYGQPLSIVLCDIDSFKNVNDTYGHLKGDDVLVEVADCIRRSLRNEIDWIVRYGGEEFLIVLPQTDVRGAVVAAERVRKSIEECAIPLLPGHIKVTASLGVSEVGRSYSGLEHAISSTISSADLALYKAKRLGKNRVVAFPRASSTDGGQTPLL
jgi:diguanylate cyclase (GGDEF)-like protein